MQAYASTITQHGCFIDSRDLTIAIEFYQMSFEQLTSLAIDTSTLIERITNDNFVSKWRFNSKAIKGRSVIRNIQKHSYAQKPIDYSCYGFAISPIVYDDSTLRKQYSYIQHDFSCLVNADPGLSVDFGSYWDELFPNGREPNELVIRKLQQLFLEEGRKHTTVYTAPDFRATFFSRHYTKRSQRYCGKFSFSISAYCLGKMVSGCADLILSELRQMANQYTSMNARVMLQPFASNNVGQSPHMRYFAEPYGRDGSHEEVGLEPSEWYPFYYLCGIEWANIVSPLAQTHLIEQSIYSCTHEECITESLNCGSLLVKSAKPIAEFGVNDLLLLKRHLYPALYPGKSSIPLSFLFRKETNNFFRASFPRSNWANIPILDGEISIIGSDLVFSPIECD